MTASTLPRIALIGFSIAVGVGLWLRILLAPLACQTIDPVDHPATAVLQIAQSKAGVPLACG